ncbi:helix-turn-helix domain-containing protein [Streptomyces hesseae]|uniref:Helix-turn-helix domain-containing protein n=1 Tax=Streptomyces hesseae TaxID=3075519 RepID=A0ABU2SYX9_9ACTN|nr:helix-turn-helix domain-containing protein [Streptomyces sp. DSM 40473]MDT0453105.1 helix-turn-helix domain-containing protein [Streptomyces sp. DSM 40473]
MDKGKRITGAAREEIAGVIKNEYEGGKTIRAVAETHGRSYGFVHSVLTASGAHLRTRSGSTRRKNN